MAVKDIKLRVSQTGAEQAAAGMGKLDKSIQSVTSAALKYAGAYFSAKGIISAATSSLEAFGKQELAEKKLQTALGKTSQALLSQASALQQMTTYGDESIIEAQALISAFTKEESQIQELTKVTLDLASAKGMDLKSAADLVAKSFGSSTNALSRYGIEVTAAAGSTERMEQITAEISRLYGGQAAAAADTYTGAMQQMKNAIGDVQETIGSFLAPQIIAAAKAIKDWSVQINTNLNTIKNLESGNYAAIVSLNEFIDTVLFTGEASDAAINGINSFTLALRDGKVSTDDLAKAQKNINDLLTSSDLSAEYRAMLEPFAEIINNSYELISVNKQLLEVQTANKEAMNEAYQAAVDFTENEIFQSNLLTEIEIANNELIKQSTIDSKQAQIDMSLMLLGVEKDASDNYGKMWEQAEQKRRAEAEKTALREIQLNQLRLAQNASTISGFIGGIAQLNRATEGSVKFTARLMQAQALIDTYAAANRALATGVPPFSYIQAAASIAMGLSNVAMIQKQNFATGGIVPGSSYSGDRVQANVNSGEMILNEQQQKQLFNMANGGTGGTGGITINVQGNLVASEEEADRFAALIVKRSKLGFNRVAVQ